MSDKKFSTGKLVALLIVLGWVVVVGVYTYRHIINPPAIPATPLSDDMLGDEWYNVMYQGKKIGWAGVTYRKLPDGYGFDSKSVLRMVAQETPIDAEINLAAIVNDAFEIRDFQVDMVTDFQTIHIDGEVKDDTLTYRIESPKGAEPETKRLTISEKPQLMDMVGRNIARGGLEVGKQFTVPVFDPLSQRNDRAVAEVVGTEQVTIGDKTYDTYVVQVRYLGLEMTSWLDVKGRAVKSDTGMGFSMYMTTQEDAMDLGAAGEVDVVVESAVKTNVKFANPRDISYLKVRLLGVDDLSGLGLDGGAQSDDGDTVEITIPDFGEGYELPDTGSEREAERRPGDLVQSDDPAIIEAAENAVGDTTNSIEAALRLNRWVYENVEKVNAFTIPSAREVLESMKGDCNEHTQLYVALARAVGLPARVAAGVVYLDGAFYYHAWPEVWLSETAGWVPVDPTFGIFPADATHVRLVLGALASQAEIARFIGKLKIEIIDYR